MRLDRSQSEYRSIEKLLSPRMQDMLDKAIEMYRTEAENQNWRGFNEKKLWDSIMNKLSLSHYEAKLLEIAENIWSGTAIKIPLIEFHGFDRHNKERIITGLCTYLSVEHVLIKKKDEERLHQSIKIDSQASGNNIATCSQCGKKVEYGPEPPDECPHCGAKTDQWVN